VIARTWHGWTASSAGADAYEAHFRSAVLPALEQIHGFVGAQLLRREAGPEIELVAMTFFESIQSVRGFAGDDYERAVVEPEARRVLSRFDQHVVHYQLLITTGATPSDRWGPQRG
jgi:heme-degrading monooxygenase HmoA